MGREAPRSICSQVAVSTECATLETYGRHQVPAAQAIRPNGIPDEEEGSTFPRGDRGLRALRPTSGAPDFTNSRRSTLTFNSPLSLACPTLKLRPNSFDDGCRFS